MNILDVPVPHRKKIYKSVQTFQATGSILDSNITNKRHVLRKNCAKLVPDWRHFQESLM
jgi:hypothetical protein